MKNRIWGIVILGLLFISGCYWRTLFPLFSKDELVTNDELPGYWMAPDSAGGWIFEKGEDNTYDITLLSKDKSTKGVGCLGMINKHLYLDIQPSQSFISDKNYDTYALPLHSFSQIQVNRKSLLMISMNFEWLKQLLKKRSSELRHEWVNESLVITAQTAELQKFTARYADNVNAFSDTSAYFRAERPRK
jgi:hypothetical protein